MQKTNLLNKEFGNLTVIKEGGGKIVGRKNPKKRSTWICLCSCGKEVEVLTTNLTRPNNKGTTSCGCNFKNSIKYNFEDLKDKEYGQLTVIKLLEEKTKTRGCLWECQCKCGNIKKFPSNSLTSGNNITCGDKKKHSGCDELDHKWNRVGEIPLSHLNAIKQNAIKRNLNYTVTPEYLWNLFLKQNRKCALSGVQLDFTLQRNSSRTRSIGTTASLDRINSKIGYIEDNVRWIHKELNIMRGSLSDERFLYWCGQCFNNQYSVENVKSRPSFDEYMLMLAFDVSLRSEDPNIRHGAVITNSHYHIIGTGYNATIKGSDKNIIPMNNRDLKRKWMIHAEENAILNSTNNPLNLTGHSKIYVTGIPCVNCLQRIINFGITEIYHAKRLGTSTDNEETEDMRRKLIDMSNIKVFPMDIDTFWLKKTMCGE